MACRNLLIVIALAALSATTSSGLQASGAAAHQTASPAAHAAKGGRQRQDHAAAPNAARKAAHAKTRPATGKKTPGKKHLVAAATAGASGAPKVKGAKAPGQPARTRTTGTAKAKAALPPPLRGSRQSLARQNARTDADGLERIEDEEDLKDRIARRMLVPVPASSALAVSASLPQDRRYCRPWTASFLTDLARAHAAQFHRPIEVSSAVRTVAYQKRLLKTNGNAAAAEGGIVSPHVTGATVNIAKEGLSRQEIGWMRRWLLSLQKAGKLDVEEEFHQACFHITVYRAYLPPKPARNAAPPKAARSRSAQPSGSVSRGR